MCVCVCVFTSMLLGWCSHRTPIQSLKYSFKHKNGGFHPFLLFDKKYVIVLSLWYLFFLAFIIIVFSVIVEFIVCMEISSSSWTNHSGNIYCGLIQEGGVGVDVGVGNTDWWMSAINIWWHFSDKCRVLSGWTVFIWKDSTSANTHPNRFMTHWILSASDGIISYSNEPHYMLHTHA